MMILGLKNDFWGDQTSHTSISRLSFYIKMKILQSKRRILKNDDSEK